MMMMAVIMPMAMMTMMPTTRCCYCAYSMSPMILHIIQRLLIVRIMVLIIKHIVLVGRIMFIIVGVTTGI